MNPERIPSRDRNPTRAYHPSRDHIPSRDRRESVKPIWLDYSPTGNYSSPPYSGQKKLNALSLCLTIRVRRKRPKLSGTVK